MCLGGTRWKNARVYEQIQILGQGVDGLRKAKPGWIEDREWMDLEGQGVDEWI